MDPILEIARRRGLIVIEDAAQAHAARYKGKRCGSLGHMGCFSFYPGKNLGAYGEGGCVTTDDPKYAETIRLLRDWGAAVKYHHKLKGYNYRMEGIQGAILRVKLKHLDAANRRRREIASMYREAFAGLPLVLQKETGKSNYHLFVVVTPERDALRRHLLEEGIPTAIHYPLPLHRQKAFEMLRQPRSNACPDAYQLCGRVLSLPMHAHLARHEVERVVSAVRSFFASRRVKSESS